MSASKSFLPSLLVGAGALLCIGMFFFAAILIEEEDRERKMFDAVAAAIPQTLFQLQKKHWATDSIGKVKRRLSSGIMNGQFLQYSRTILVLPLHFPWMISRGFFRVSRSIYDNLQNNLCTNDDFFRDWFDVTGRRKVATDDKILIALKALAYGTSVNVFRDYSQMGESTAQLCLTHFIYGIFRNGEYCQLYLWSMSAADSRRDEAMHYEQHGIHGMAGSLDCSHVAWNNCPVVHQGQF
jgi:hypothetical protein